MKIVNQLGTELNLSGKKETTYNLYVQVKDENDVDYNFTGASGKMEIRGSYKSAVIAEFTVSLATGLITITKLASEMDFRTGKYVYDLKITYANSEVHRWLFGQFEMLDRSTT